MADYNINAVTRKVSYTGSAGVGPYAFSFEILAEGDVAVYFNTTLLTLTTDYSVTINANGTGSVTIVVGTNVPTTPDANDTIIIVGARDIERTTDFVTAGDLRAAALNEQLDSGIIFDQQISERVDRALTAPVYDPTGIDMTLPAKADRAGTVLGFNATTGDPEAGPAIADVSTLAAITADIATLADIEDGTDATDAIQTVAANNSNVTTVAGISGNVTTVAGSISNVNTVATDLSGDDDIGTVAGSISSVNTVGGSIASVNTNASNISSINTNASNITAIQNASANATAAATSASNASTSETNAATSATNAATSATNAANSASSASASASTATTQANAASSSASAASTSETNAASSASAASTSASQAATSASNASTSESNAATSASSASTSASAAATSATSAASSAASAAALLDNFDDRYLGAKSADPALDNDGDALVVGALYFNTTDGVMKVYTASGWVEASSAQIATMNKFKFTATSGQTVFTGADDDANTLSINVGAEIVTLNGVVLEAGTDYTPASGSITLASGAATSDELNVFAFANFQVADTVSASTGGAFAGAVTFDGGANFGDNDKAIFGAGSDLQIYHNSSNNRSFIAENGTADLYIQANDLRLVNADSSAFYAYFVNGGAASLYHNNSAKLATTSTGIDVTGTVTADGLTIDGGGMLLDSSGDSVFTMTVGGTSNNARIDFNNGTSVDGGITYDHDGAFASEKLVLRAGNNTSHVYLTGDGKVGIGTSSPVADLTINKDTNTKIQIISSNGGTNRIVFGDQADQSRGDITYDHSNEALIFSNNNLTERMRITSSGAVLIGKTAPEVLNTGVEFGPIGYIGASRSAGPSLYLERTTNDGDVAAFYRNNTQVGGISVTLSSTSFNTSSDYRLKENVVEMTGAIDRVKALKPSQFNFIADPDTTVDGFIAHEAQEIVPESVTGTKDAVDAEGNPEYQGIDQSKLVPLLTGALQEAIARIETLEAQVATLQGN